MRRLGCVGRLEQHSIYKKRDRRGRRLLHCKQPRSVLRREMLDAPSAANLRVARHPESPRSPPHIPFRPLMEAWYRSSGRVSAGVPAGTTAA